MFMLEQYKSGKWLVAVSTGPDSMALLDMCVREGLDIVVGHVNYHHQNQAEQEEQYIRQYCLDNNLELFVRNDEFKPIGNFEAEARDWRYEFFVEVVRNHNLTGVMIAHHQDDHIETFLLQQERNQVPDTWGLNKDTTYKGIRVVRPLLSFTKQDLINYCDQRDIKYYIDETNDSDEYERNRIRHEVVDKLTDFERKMVLLEIEKYNAEWKERRCRVGVEIREDTIELSRYRQLDRLDRLTLLRMFVSEKTNRNDYSRKHLEAIDSQLLKQSDIYVELGKRVLYSNQGYMYISLQPKEYCYTFNNLEELMNVKKEYFFVDRPTMGVNAITLKEDDFPITIRNFEEGDYIHMRFGTKKVSRFFIDRKISKYLRKIWPIVLNKNNQVILVPGLGCDVVHYSTTPDCCVIQYLNSKEDCLNA